jgi:hypothetical protein
LVRASIAVAARFLVPLWPSADGPNYDANELPTATATEPVQRGRAPVLNDNSDVAQTITWLLAGLGPRSWS